jgi:hypothetical protein
MAHRKHLFLVKRAAQWRLTLPSSGRPNRRFAPVGPPLMSNVRPPRSHMTMHTAHKANALGDFYVEDGCCTSCGMPTTVAPDLFEYENDGHCYVSRQPFAPDEVDRMVSAFQVQDVGCIRYKGSNRVIQIRLVGLGEGDQCDLLDSDLKARSQGIKAKRVAADSPSRASECPEGSHSVLQRVVRWLRHGS